MWNLNQIVEALLAMNTLLALIVLQSLWGKGVFSKDRNIRVSSGGHYEVLGVPNNSKSQMIMLLYIHNARIGFIW